MSFSIDPLDDLLSTLVRLRDRCGAPLYKRALAAARVAVGRVVLSDAERLAGVETTRPKGIVVQFPAGARSKNSGDNSRGRTP